MAALLVAVKSSFEKMEAGAHDKIRGSWGQELRGRAHLKFFIGRDTPLDRTMANNNPRHSYSPKSDEVILDCPDEDNGMVFKTRGICGYVGSKNISHALIVGTNTRLLVKKFLAINCNNFDYMGHFNGEIGDIAAREVPGPNGIVSLLQQSYPWASGAGYLLSSDAARDIADHYPQPALAGGYGGSDDVWVGQVLGPIIQRGNLFAAEFDFPIYES